MKKLNTIKTMNQKKDNKGFTLIELMIVIAIIGILASVAIPQYQQYTRSANAQTIVTQANSYQTAISLCAQLNGGTLTGCNAATNNIPAVSNEVTGITNGVITMNLGDIDGDGTDEVVTVNPFVAAASVVWGVYSNSGTDVCAAANDWLDCNQAAFVAAGGTAP